MYFEIDNIRQTVSIAMIAGVLALFLPYLIAVLNQPKMKPEVRGLISQVVYGVAAVFVAFWQGDFENTADIFAAALPIFIVGMTKYNFLDKPSMLATRVEYATSGRNIDLYSHDVASRGQSVQSPGVTTIVTPGAVAEEVLSGTVPHDHA